MKKWNFKKKKMKNKISTMVGVLYGIVYCPTIVQAGDPLAQITAGANAVKAFFLGIVGVVGAIIFVRNASDFGAAIQDRDRNGMVSGFFGMIGGAVMALAGPILTLFGIS